jgi:hypothetical protein
VTRYIVHHWAGVLNGPPKFIAETPNFSDQYFTLMVLIYVDSGVVRFAGLLQIVCHEGLL